jgi:hypothetical protein
LVMYTGGDTRSAMNTSRPPSKVATLDLQVYCAGEGAIYEGKQTPTRAKIPGGGYSASGEIPGRGGGCTGRGRVEARVPDSQPQRTFWPRPCRHRSRHRRLKLPQPPPSFFMYLC